jgi:hypothetical protein
MTSTYVSYQVLARDISRSLERTEANPVIARDGTYYRENIGKVTSIDDLLDDHRLYSYAMKAHGLDDMIYAKAFMRKVLESDLTDLESFAMKLVDVRYRTFAQSFNFGTDGLVKGELPHAQADYQEDDTVALYSEHRLRQGTAAAADAEYYREEIAAVQSVDAFLADDRLFAYALTAYGIDHTIASKPKIKEALLSDLSDPASVANQLGPRYAKLAAAFDFAADGSVGPQGAQSAADADATVFLYYENSGNGASPAAAALRANYYAEAVPGITNVDNLVNDARLFDLALTAFGLSPASHSPAVIRQVLTSDLSDPGSFANTLDDPRYAALAAAFNFSTNGSVNGTAQSAEDIETTLDRYLANQDDLAEASDQVATTFYRSRIDTVISVDALIDDVRLYNYVLSAFDLDPAVEDETMIRRVLTSDPTDPFSFVNRLDDPRYLQLASAFNFSADGSVAMPRIAQVDKAKLETIRLYNTRIGTSESEEEAAKKENAYYNSTIGRMQSVDELLEDERLVTYLVTAYGLSEEEDLSTDLLRDVLISDPMDKESVANELENTGFRDLAAAFNFDTEGNVARAPEQQVQTRGEIIQTADLYLRLTMETAAGEENPGVRLALYFQRKAQVIDSPFDILADKALYEVVRTALGLPDTVALANTEAQAKMLEKRLDFQDFQDPKKVDRFLAQFSVLYDMRNSAASEPSIASVLMPVLPAL